MQTFRSLLFTPADRPDRFARALTSRADAVCLDLEDAIAPGKKTEARAHAAAFLREHDLAGPSIIGVRINPLDSSWWAEDVAATAGADFLLLPKAVSAVQLAMLRAARPNTPLWPLVETAEGLRNCWQIAAAPGVEGVLFGAFDYAADVGCTMDWEPLLFVRSQLAAAAARARIQLLDAPSGELADMHGLRQQTLRVKALGFTGRACIHPAQIGAVNAAFTSSQAEIDAALRILEAFDAAGEGVAQLDGKLLEKPVALAARRVLARANGFQGVN